MNLLRSKLLLFVLISNVFALNYGEISFEYLSQVEPKIVEDVYDNQWNDRVKEEIYLGDIASGECIPRGGLVYSCGGISALGLPIIALDEFNLSSETNCALVKLQNLSTGACYNFSMSFTASGSWYFEFDGEVSRASKC